MRNQFGIEDVSPCPACATMSSDRRDIALKVGLSGLMWIVAVMWLNLQGLSIIGPMAALGSGGMVALLTYLLLAVSAALCSARRA